MNKFALLLAALAGPALHVASATDAPYKVLQTAELTGTGGTDYVFADGDNRRLYVPRGNSIVTFDLDTLKPLTPIPGLMGGHGVAVDPVSGHGFSSSSPILMWDAKTLQPIKTIQAQGRPDGIIFEPTTERIYVLSHAEPNVTVLDGKDGSTVGTIDLGASPEQAQPDGNGHVYIDLEDRDAVAAIDAKTMKVTGTFSLQGKGSGPGGLGLDAKNQILFAYCRRPSVAVILSATDGKILGTEPTGNGCDGGGFVADTNEAFSSQGDGTVTIIKENSPTDFAVEQTVQTMQRARTSTIDKKTGHIIVIATERPTPAPGASPSATGSNAAPGGQQGGGPGRRGGFGGGFRGPSVLRVMVIGR